VNRFLLTITNERSILKRKLAIEKRRLEEIRMLQGGGLQRAISLISEAEYVGLLYDNVEVDYDSYEAVYKVLKSVNEWTPVNAENELEQLNQDISNAKKFAGETSGYANEVEHQKIRLSSIGLFEKLDFRPDHCPLCSYVQAT
jgi:gamma-glutamylcysteine synthetase